MSTDNRTEINDCEAVTGWVGSDAVTVTTLAGQFFEGASSLSTQLTNADEQMHTVEDSLNTGTYSLDWSDSTLYMLIKDNIQQDAASGGIQFVIGDGTDLIGYDIGGRDAPGMPLSLYFFAMKLDVSVIVATPGTFTNFTGTEANLAQTTCTQIGYGSIHAAKAQGPVDNVFMDNFRFIANDSYALTVNGGTTGTPETVTDLVGDDIAGGWGMVSNPFGSVYLFFAPTEWGNTSTVAEHAFTATDQQWFMYGNNGGGHAVGVTHFPMRFISNATDTGEIKLTNILITNLGTRAEWLMDDADFNTIELETCSFVGAATIGLPSSGGTSRFVKNTTFDDCDAVTHNGADTDGCVFKSTNVAANSSAMIYNEAADPDGETDNMSFTMGATLTHAVEFGTSSPLTMTLRNWTCTGYNASNAQNDSTFHILRTSGTVTINLVGFTGNSSFRTAGATVLIVSTVSVNVNVTDSGGTAIQDAQVYIQRASPTANTSGAGNNAGDGDLVTTATISADAPQEGYLSVLDISEQGNANHGVQGYRYASHDSANTYTLPTTVAFACTGGGTGTSLQDTVNDFTGGGKINVEEGDTIRNTTDGSWAVVDEIVDIDNITTTQLEGGSDDTWTSGDTYSLHDLATTLVSGTDIIDDPLLVGQTDSSGDAPTLSYDATQAPTAVDIRVRSNNGATKYIPGKASGTISATAGLALNIILQEDTVAT